MKEENNNNFYLYHGKYVEMNPEPFNIKYEHILTMRNFFGFRLKDKIQPITEEEFIELSKNKLYNFRYIKEFNDGGFFDKIGIFSLLSDGVPCVYKRMKYSVKYLFENKDDFILRARCSNNDINIPWELIEYSIWGEHEQKEFQHKIKNIKDATK